MPQALFTYDWSAKLWMVWLIRQKGLPMSIRTMARCIVRADDKSNTSNNLQQKWSGQVHTRFLIKTDLTVWSMPLDQSSRSWHKARAARTPKSKSSLSRPSRRWQGSVSSRNSPRGVTDRGHAHCPDWREGLPQESHRCLAQQP